jgi:hypothetical protein
LIPWLATDHGPRCPRREGIFQAGERGAQGTKGEPGASIIDWRIDQANYQAIPVMSDGTEGPPLPLRGLFEQFHDEAKG